MPISATPARRAAIALLCFSSLVLLACYAIGIGSTVAESLQN